MTDRNRLARALSLVAYPVGRPTFAAFVAVLLLVDGMFLALHVTIELLSGGADLWPRLKRFDIQWEHGLPERFNYWKWFSCVLLLAAACLKSRRIAFAWLSGAFLVIFADDFLQLHERGGAFLAERLGAAETFALRGQDFGELIVWAGLGVPVIAFFCLAALGRAPGMRRQVAHFAAAVVLLIGLGIGVDMLHMIAVTLTGSAYLDLAFGLLEDGGELILGSLLCAYSLAALVGARAGEPAPVRARAAGGRLGRDATALPRG